jgi:hypothetical protein
MKECSVFGRSICRVRLVIPALLLAGFVAFSLFQSALVRPAHAQTRYLRERIGRWGDNFYLSGYDAFGLSQPEARAYITRLEAFAEVFHASPVVNPPVGFQAWAHLHFDPYGCGNGSKCRGVPIQAWVNILVYYFMEGENGKPVWGGESNTHVDFRINNLDAAFGGRSLFDGRPAHPDGMRKIYYEPRQTRTLGGFPIYDDSQLVISHSRRPWFVPVTREQYLKASITFNLPTIEKAEQDVVGYASYVKNWIESRAARRQMFEKLNADVKKSDPEKYARLLVQWDADDQKTTADIEKALKRAQAGVTDPSDPFRKFMALLSSELEALTPAERASDAWCNPHKIIPGSGLVPPNSPDSRRLVTTNPDFFDKTLPRADFQFVTGTFEWSGGITQIDAIDAVKQFPDARLWEWMRTTPWEKIADMVRQ